jgi:hypothetical protein
MRGKKGLFHGPKDMDRLKEQVFKTCGKETTVKSSNWITTDLSCC